MGIIDDRHINPNMNDKDHIVGKLTLSDAGASTGQRGDSWWRDFLVDENPNMRLLLNNF